MASKKQHIRNIAHMLMSETQHKQMLDEATAKGVEMLMRSQREWQQNKDRDKLTLDKIRKKRPTDDR